ncbi:MAG: TlyA family RNA methyltransferase [Candidatus Saccharimonadales bacterium]
MKQRLDSELVARKLASTRSQAENIIKLGQVEVNGQVISKPAFQVSATDKIKLSSSQQYVSRAGLKLASVADKFKLDFRNKVVLDVGSSTGGFTDYSLQHGAAKVIAVDVGTDQLHPSLRINPKVELHEQTDIRDVRIKIKEKRTKSPEILNLKSLFLNDIPEVVLIDVSFISLRHILPAVQRLIGPKTKIVAMVKPQFEQTQPGQNNRGVIKNDRVRREILKDFENWVQKLFKVIDKADSTVAGSKGNLERFYLLEISK